jgi:N-acetylmuramoyl-L-alanine amidase
MPVRPVPVVVLNPAHGGTDAGARGATGAIEKDIVLQYARAIRGDLERANFRVVLTREDDSNPSYDDRAAMANTYHDVFFVSIHVGSVGAAGTARVYYYRFASSPGTTSGGMAATALQEPSASSLVTWEQAQAPYADSSHRLADALQSEIAQRLSGSPIMATAVPVRELRSISSPAVAVEVSSVSVTDPNSLSALAPQLSAAITQGLQAFRSASQAGAH